MPAVPPPVATFLLPERRRLAGAPPAWLARAFPRLRVPDPVVEPGEQAQVQRCFAADGVALPVAAIQRDADAGDAGNHAWVRADPVWLRADQGGVRLMAWGNLGLSAGEADALVEAVAPALGAFDVDIGRTDVERWYLRLPPGLAAPAVAWPADALGSDLLPHLPGGPAARTWAQLLVEAQVTLHQHPVNSARLQRGLPPANSLWLWGGGTLGPTRALVKRVVSREPVLRALAMRSGLPLAPPGGAPERGDLVDVRDLRAWAQVATALQPLFGLRHAATGVVLDFADGCLALSPAWRRLPRRFGTGVPRSAAPEEQ